MCVVLISKDNKGHSYVHAFKLTNVLGGQFLTAASNRGLHVPEHRVAESLLLSAVVQTVLEKTVLVAVVHSKLTLPQLQSVLRCCSISLTSTS